MSFTPEEPGVIMHRYFSQVLAPGCACKCSCPSIAHAQASQVSQQAPRLAYAGNCLNAEFQVQGPGTDFDYFAAPPPTVTSPELLPLAPANFEKGMDFPMMSSLDSESAGSDMSALDVLLEEFSSNQMAEEFDAWLKDMPCPELEPCKI